MVRAARNPQVATAGLSSRARATRDKLKEAARYLINRDGYSSVRVEDITTEAGVAKGLFYRYFSDLRDVTYEVCGDLFSTILASSAESNLDEAVPSYQWLYDFIFVPVEQFNDNPGLLACMFELRGSFPEIFEAWTSSAHDWNLRLGDFIQQRTDMSEDEADRTCFILGAVMEGILYQAIIRKNPDLRKMGTSTASITETIATTWYRCIFLAPPPKKASGPEARLLQGEKKKKQL